MTVWAIEVTGNVSFLLNLSNSILHSGLIALYLVFFTKHMLISKVLPSCKIFVTHTI